MLKVLLTGGTGFIGAHILEVLLGRGYSVVCTARSITKGDKILQAHPNLTDGTLAYVVVEDVGQSGAFDEAVKSEPPFDVVIHAASPFHNNFKEPKEIVEPAVNCTRGLLSSVKAFAPSVKRVVLTSSFAAIFNSMENPKVYDETSWNPVTLHEAMNERSKAYRGSKTFAEKAAWQFIKDQKPNFDLVTLLPPLVYGPVSHDLSNLDGLNTSNQGIRDLIQGRFREELPPIAGSFLWVDVRDIALAHVKAAEISEAGGNRFLITAGHYSNRMIVDAIRETHPELSSKLPSSKIDDLPKEVYGYDVSKANRILGLTFHPLEKSIGDTVTSLLNLESSSRI